MLAGGRSARFGSNKLEAVLRGMPLLHHAVLRAAEVCHEVVVVVAPGAPEPSLPPGVAATVVRDATEGEGPVAGLMAGLLAAAGDDLALVAGGDMPDLQIAVLLEMLRVAEGVPVEAVALQDGDRFRPLPCVVRTGPAAEAAHFLLHAGRRRLRDVLGSLRLAVIDEPTWTGLDPERRTLFDVDEPADLGS
ncbi:MAG: molybdenum cofactor guanylyltransferase [Actinobacteria bacterium]|nr:molybdenum cofactor guanylyltransferase [Actinomycetota bacterium]